MADDEKRGGSKRGNTRVGIGGPAKNRALKKKPAKLWLENLKFLFGDEIFRVLAGNPPASISKPAELSELFKATKIRKPICNLAGP